MLIPSIDLRGGQVVQLVQGKRPALASDDIDGWVEKFRGFPRVQVIDLDAAMGSGSNAAIIRRIAPRLRCRVGGGVRTINRARDMLDAGASAVIVGSSLFDNGQVDVAFAESLAAAVGPEQVIAAIDSKHGRVVIKGWTEATPLTAVEAARALEPYCAEFLYTHVDREGLMQGTDMEAILAVRRATARRLTAAGGITTQAEIDQLDAEGIDAVVGMAIYTGRIDVTPPTPAEAAPP
ncbi:MAG: 1-(5-phosphoribosyl)-5-[(5-phosphoribosylamino)methylideneamino] imidazole-4-carboxamide isomerase [Acidobacteria bacterium]|nr:1-(5-phosphoribosyl)-5-[(5-phosphoribosylamino)methylideneamino] imidazole-4-carboxamide isomerase [Acidobacteriota bacterium]MXZ70124.1 1-(5-phosphoribosyl)-5-[(5-phosphoribosylamino)methylideneamino] imidazole-4-carboxamide isomerase [Acidobacteriota bacterium]MYJ03105.1 1-(5-phosphoribosyl)-5-[(5-phosphoribosylamino)methylideneamino] imidazole-4-carboxamide isomerase [Acidobacteriota bacterium]